jgi:hypothetical protein
MVDSMPLAKDEVKAMLINFYKLSAGRDLITLLHFKERIKFGKKHSHSLFKHLVDSNSGTVSFLEYVKKMIPKIRGPELKRVSVWV